MLSEIVKDWMPEDRTVVRYITEIPECRILIWSPEFEGPDSESMGCCMHTCAHFHRPIICWDCGCKGDLGGVPLLWTIM